MGHGAMGKKMPVGNKKSKRGYGKMGASMVPRIAGYRMPYYPSLSDLNPKVYEKLDENYDKGEALDAKLEKDVAKIMRPVTNREIYKAVDTIDNEYRDVEEGLATNTEEIDRLLKSMANLNYAIHRLHSDLLPRMKAASSLLLEARNTYEGDQKVITLSEEMVEAEDKKLRDDYKAWCKGPGSPARWYEFVAAVKCKAGIWSEATAKRFIAKAKKETYLRRNAKKIQAMANQVLAGKAKVVPINKKAKRTTRRLGKKNVAARYL